ncbi:hypothetical protein EIN_134840 [Entamoeba invadens IP1]|uniref:Uncharacterized protein n=1 Tax=Entamoeba invadens IP1 TaxID=370355 RepID=A0A0A1TX76_ENTIV|nr:hypothetical protein EIN_134840 [Entamoeba invadens IP1]ELP85910.1 hypothetical protein EIN_134840 [Entamoeba invadens IP1]|eukprot:XP_004185256.1 hypothetical protein EIN_134840 [Entamoeba invadens IP1]
MATRTNGVPFREKSLPFKTKCSREKRNLEAVQQAILVGLVSKMFSILIERPPKQSKVTEQIPKIISIMGESSVLEFDSFVKDRFKTELDATYSSEAERIKTLRLFNRNVFVFTNNFLLDLCTEIGYVFNTRLSKISKNTQRIEYIESVCYKGKVILTKNNLLEKGKRVCKYFSSIVIDKKQTTVEAGDVEIAKIFETSNE